MQMRMETTIKDLLTSEPVSRLESTLWQATGMQYPLTLPAMKPSINCASDLQLEIMEGDMVKIDEEETTIQASK